ncbi:hypothetical protein [Clostridium ljungdahlii]|uniref:Uncharacterized protein n=1 Tax=Clostridium ljungdahlii TaxID=1538 RepID=A0A168MS65_9CLOT|nr:hypothetical protein [Clostridium ljungdahlii]OAA85087.1 hypothetical protein WY13_02572 [Clostridium ljungdahlii]
MSVFFSEEFNVESKIEKMGVFDCLLDEDSNYFINLKRLKETQVPEFQDAYEKINKYFREIGLLLKTSKCKTDKMYRTAIKMFDFSEVNGINLGFAKGKRGSGFGEKLREQIISDAKDIINTGSEQPEIFHLLSLFENDVGPDRLSDMIARLIYDNIVEYTQNINNKLGIIPKAYNNYKFQNGLVKNPYKKSLILLLPIDILHELPIARDWDDIDRVCRENKAIRNEVNTLVRLEWKKFTTGYKKDYLKKNIFMKPEKLGEVIKAYNSMSIEPYNIFNNNEYFIQKVAHNYKNKFPITIESNKSSFEASLEICNHFKDLIENNKGYEVLYIDKKPRDEKIVQCVLYMTAEYYCKANKLDISRESNTGRGPVDFKISRGVDKTVIEIKLTTNKETVHGFEVQIEEYAKSEKTNNKIFMMIDNGGPKKRINDVYKIYEERKSKNKNPAEIVLIDAKPKDSASKYKLDKAAKKN